MITRIALAGRKFCGKDTIAEEIEQHGYKILSFSDQLKGIAYRLFPFMNLDYSSEDKESKVVFKNEETGIEYNPRMIWQSLDILPQIYPNVFVDMLDREVEDLVSMMGIIDVAPRMCIKDVRRPAELEYVKKREFTLIYVESDDDRSVNSAADHLSESFQDLLKSQADLRYFNSKKDENYKQHINEFIQTFVEVSHDC